MPEFHIVRAQPQAHNQHGSTLHLSAGSDKAGGLAAKVETAAPVVDYGGTMRTERSGMFKRDEAVPRPAEDACAAVIFG